jgi:hypothetical protein
VNHPSSLPLPKKSHHSSLIPTKLYNIGAQLIASVSVSSPFFLAS